jgi:hypothetical protein
MDPLDLYEQQDVLGEYQVEMVINQLRDILLSSGIQDAIDEYKEQLED